MGYKCLEDPSTVHPPLMPRLQPTYPECVQSRNITEMIIFGAMHNNKSGRVKIIVPCISKHLSMTTLPFPSLFSPSLSMEAMLEVKWGQRLLPINHHLLTFRSSKKKVMKHRQRALTPRLSYWVNRTLTDVLVYMYHMMYVNITCRLFKLCDLLSYPLP